MKEIAEHIISFRGLSKTAFFTGSKSKRILIFAFIASVSACSFKTLYNNLDYLIPSYVEGMVSLDDMLEEKVEQRTEGLVSWHRNTQLKQYASLLGALQHDFSPQLTAERVSRQISAMESLWQPLAEKLNEEMAVLLPLLTHEQLNELFESIDDKNEDFYDDYVDLDNEEYIEVTVDRLAENFENWLGELTEQQEHEIEKAAARFHRSASLRLEQRKKWQRGIRNILYAGNNAELKSEQLRDFFKVFDTQRDAALSTADEANKQVIAWLTVKMVHTSVPDQKEYFINKTGDYIRIFNELAENR